MIDIIGRPLAIDASELARAQNSYSQQIKTPQGESKPPFDFLGFKIATNKKKIVEYSQFADDQEIQSSLEIDGRTYGNVAILEIRGFIQKQSYFDWWNGRWVYGIDEISKSLDIIGNDPRIKAVMITVDSGGGQVAGVETLSRSITKFRGTYKKQVWAFVDSCACSAAYWLISGADKIIMAEDTAQVGSIGILVSLSNWSEYQKNLGVVTRDIKASLSINKNKAYEDAMKGNDKLLIEQLDKINSVFLRDIQNNRGVKAGIAQFDLSTATPENVPEILTGQVYYGQDARQVGLVDEVSERGLSAEIARLQRDRGTTTQEAVPNVLDFLIAK